VEQETYEGTDQEANNTRAGDGAEFVSVLPAYTVAGVVPVNDTGRPRTSFLVLKCPQHTARL